MAKQLDWQDMTPAQQAVAQAQRQRTHGSAGGELRLAVEDARAQAFSEAIEWLQLRGYSEASEQLEAAAFEGGQPDGT